MTTKKSMTLVESVVESIKQGYMHVKLSDKNFLKGHLEDDLNCIMFPPMEWASVSETEDNLTLKYSDCDIVLRIQWRASVVYNENDKEHEHPVITGWVVDNIAILEVVKK